MLAVLLTAAAACIAGLVVLQAPLEFEEFSVEADAPIPVERVRLRERDSFRAHFLLLHGYGANRAYMRPLAEVLAAGGGDVYLMDLPGRGDHPGVASTRPESGPHAAMPTPRESEAALAVFHELERRGVPRERLVLVGHSLGGGVAVDVARRTLPAATVSLAGLERRVDPGRPRNLLLITSRLEIPALRRAADQMHRQSRGPASARREFFGAHSSLPYQSNVQQAVVEWAVRSLGARLETPPWLNEKLLALKLGALLFLGLAFPPLATLAGFRLAHEPFGEVVSETRLSNWSPPQLAGFALLGGLASVSALSIVAWLLWPNPLAWLRLADGDSLASVMLLSTLWLLPALRHPPWVRDAREVRSNLLAAAGLAAFGILAGGGFFTWQLFDLWPTPGRLARALALLLVFFPYALGEELLRRTFSKQRGKSPLTAFLLWRLALLASIAYGVLLLGTGEAMILLIAVPLLFLSLVEHYSRKPSIALSAAFTPPPLSRRCSSPGSSPPSFHYGSGCAPRSRCYTGSPFMNGIKRVVIAGGGPAGALCGERLARAGFAVTILEERPDWEKPCGGGVTWKTLQRYPFLLDGGVARKLVRRAELIGADGRRVELPLSRPLALYSRAKLNAFLLQRAAEAGCTVVHQRALAASMNGAVRLRAAHDEFEADFLVIATGARNALQLTGAADGWRPAPRDLELTAGYYLPAADDCIRVRFLRDFEGYLWSFPRADHLAVGICGKMEQNSSGSLKDKLHRFMTAEGLSVSGGTFYSHLLPSLAPPSWKRLALAGPRWARVGDAAGLVDPITGEGIYYALRSGELLAEALVAGRPESYPQRVEDDFAGDLREAARWQRTFYRGRWLGSSTTDRVVAAAARSQRFRRLLDDLFAGTQDYRGLKWRLLRMLLPAN